MTAHKWPGWFVRYAKTQRVINAIMRAVDGGEVTTVRELAELSANLAARELPGDRMAAKIIREASEAMVPLLPEPTRRALWLWRGE